MFTRILFLIVLLSISISSLFAAILLPWGIDEAIDTGFIAPKTGSKDVITPEGCRKISGTGVTQDYFVPTKTTTEWDAFKANIPTGITIGSCSIPTYSWSIGGSVATDTCSSGQLRTVWCQRSDGQAVSQLYCNPATKPSTVVTWVSSIQRTTWAWWWSNGTFCANTIIWWNPAMMRNGSTVPQLFGPVSCANAGAYKPAAWQQADDLANYGTSVAFVQYAWPSLPSFPPPFDPWYTTGTSCYYIWRNHKCIIYNCDPITPPPAVWWSCGSANGVNTLMAPVSNLCNRGSSSIVTAKGANWIWSCYGSNGWGNANCSALNAPPAINASCGGSANTCSAGTPSGYAAGSCGGNKTWTCNGANGWASVTCRIRNPACPPPPPIDGVCDETRPRGCIHGAVIMDWGQTACGTTRLWKCDGQDGGNPTQDYCKYVNTCTPISGSCDNSTPLGCSAGTAKLDNNQISCNTTRTWVCAGKDGGSDSPQCSRGNGICFPTNGSCDNSTPLGCSAGTATSDNNQTSCNNTRTWKCQGTFSGTTASCSRYNGACPPTSVNGSCDNSTPLGCSAGTATLDNNQISCNTTRTWVCAGQNGGTNSTQCSRSNGACAPTPVNGSCNNSTPLGCSAGTATSDNNQTSCSTTRTWVCAGQNGGTNSTQCSKANPVCPPTTYNETSIMRMGNAETNSLEWSINLRTGVANYWNGFRWWTQFTLLGWFTPQSAATMASYSKVAVSIEREGRPGSWNGRRWWHLPYQVQAPTALNDWTTIWRVDRKGGNSTDGQWSMKMTTLTGPYEYMFVSVYKYSDPVDLFNPVYDPSTTTITKKVQALGSTTVAQVNYNTTTPEWSKTYAPLSDCVVPSTLDPSGFCPSGWTPTKVVPSNSICGGATGNGKKEDPNALFWIYEPVLIMTQICRR